MTKRWDGIKDENSNILGVHWKIQLSRGGFMENQYREEDSLKRGAWTVC